MGTIRARRKFKARNSLLTDLYEQENFKTIHHIGYATLILSLLYNVFMYFTTNSTRLCFHVIAQGFTEFHRAIFVWLLMCLCTFLVQPVFNFWAKRRTFYKENGLGIKAWDFVWILIWILFYVFFLILPTCVTFSNRLILASAFVVTAEQMRMLMKIHAYLRSNVSKILRTERRHIDQQITLLTFEKFAYFFFCPTLLYRDFYPRTQQIRWSFVISNLVDFIASFLYISLIASNQFIPLIESSNVECYSWTALFKAIFLGILPFCQIIIVGFYLLYHCWLNIWAELLQFADREFYLDWWNSATYTVFFRRWSSIIHEFLHEYLYRDFFEIVVPGNKFIAMLLVFVISGIIHEIMLAFTFNSFYPINFTQFVGTGTMLFYSTKNKQNLSKIFFWFCFLFGNSVLYTLYTIEIIARKNISDEYEYNFQDFAIPKSLSCNFY